MLVIRQRPPPRLTLKVDQLWALTTIGSGQKPKAPSTSNQTPTNSLSNPQNSTKPNLLVAWPLKRRYRPTWYLELR
jgi:hypothetical protein